MKTRIPICLLSFCLFLLIIAGCKKDFSFDKIKPLDWSPDCALPLVSDEITFESILKETNTQQNFFIDDAGDISMLYYFRDHAFRMSPSDFLTVPTFPFSFDHQISAEEQALLMGNDLSFPPVGYSFNLAEQDPEARVDKLLIKTGMLGITLSTTFNNDGHLLIRIPDATKNGQPFSYLITPFRSGNNQQTVDLSGVLLDLRSNPNLVRIQVEALLKQDDQTVVNDKIHAGFTLSVQEIKWFEGYLGKKTFSPAEVPVHVTVFNNAFVQGNVYFVDPKASVTLVNSVGVPAKVTITRLMATNSASGLSEDITSVLGESAVFTVPSPSVNSLLPAVKTIDYTNANTGNSMETLFNIKPDNVFYRLQTEINPDGTGINFFSDTSSMYANLLVKLPLFGHFDGLVVQDTFKFSMNKQKEIEKVNFRANITNGFPLQALMQVYFTDGSFHLIDSLISGKSILIKEAPVNPATFLPEPGVFGEKDTVICFDRSRMDKVAEADFILVRALLNSTDQGKTNVKIKATQKLAFHLSADISFRKDLEVKK